MTTHTHMPQTLSAIKTEQEMGVMINCKNLVKGGKRREDTKANPWKSILLVAFSASTRAGIACAPIRAKEVLKLRR